MIFGSILSREFLKTGEQAFAQKYGPLFWLWWYFHSTFYYELFIAIFSAFQESPKDIFSAFFGMRDLLASWASYLSFFVTKFSVALCRKGALDYTCDADMKLGRYVVWAERIPYRSFESQFHKILIFIGLIDDLFRSWGTLMLS